MEKAIEHLHKTKTKNCRILVHNGANPFVTSSEISEGIALAKKHKNIIFGYFSPNSIKQVKSGKVAQFLDRAEIFETQTPQISDLETFSKAIEHFNSQMHSIPKDEAELLSLIDEDIFIYECSTRNQKITFAHDLHPYLPSDQEKTKESFPAPTKQSYQIGLGEDSHRFSNTFDQQKPLSLGGIKLLKCKLSIEANSDGDLIFHALTNAILSSVGEKTLNEFSDKMCQEEITDSSEYLKKSLEIATKKFANFKIQNVIISLEAKIPKIAPHHDEIQNNIAKELEIDNTKVGLTYTSGESLSDFGKGKGIRCLVQILITI